MLDALKKLIGADEESKKRRQQALEEERREREARVRERAEALKKSAATGEAAAKDDRG